MLSAWMILILNSLFLTLRLSGNSGSFPRPLKAEEEKKYLELAKQGDNDARNVLVEHNLRLVAHIVKKYYTQSGDQDDLISIGTIGLIKGISSFNPDKNVRLATYASRCIENEILMHFRSRKKLQGEVSLSDTLDNDQEGNNLSLMDVIRVDDTMLEELDLKAAARSVGVKSVEMIHVKDINKITGYIRGGCTAVGMKKQYVTRIDSTAESLEKIIVSGGRIGSQLELAPQDLARATGAEFADIIRH